MLGDARPINRIPRSQSTSDLFEVPSQSDRRRQFLGGSAGGTRHRTTSLVNMTPYQLQRTQMKQSFQFPNGESFTPRSMMIQKAHSMVTLPAPIIRLPQNMSPSVSRPPSIVSVTSSNMQEIEEWPPRTTSLMHRSASMGDMREAGKEPRVAQTLKSKGSLNALSSAIGGSRTGDSSSGSTKRSKIAGFFKKLFPKKQKKPFDGVNEDSTESGDSILASLPVEDDSTTNLSMVFDEPPESSSLSSCEKEAGPLFDIDLVFDTLLLKTDNPEPTNTDRGKEKEGPREGNQIPLSKTINSTSNSDAGKRASSEEELDYALINEFSKLGHYINTTQKLMPPPRSSRRPVLKMAPRNQSKSPRKVVIQPSPHLEEPRSLLLGSPVAPLSSDFLDPDERLFTNLQQHWKTIHVNQNMPRPSAKLNKACKKAKEDLLSSSLVVSSAASSSSAGTASTSASSTASTSSSKRLEFANEVYVNDTYSQMEYHRSDKNFLKERKQLMGSSHGMPFIQSVKWELNEFKKYEMIVHPDSKQHTQFFL